MKRTFSSNKDLARDCADHLFGGVVDKAEVEAAVALADTPGYPFDYEHPEFGRVQRAVWDCVTDVPWPFGGQAVTT